MKRWIVATLVLASGVLAISGTARAVCTVTGEVVRTVDTSVLTYGYVRTAGLAPFVYYFSTNNMGLREAIHTADVTGRRITIQGNAAACPAAGEVRFGGTVIQTVVSP